MKSDEQAGAREVNAWLSLVVVQCLFGALPVVSKFAIAEVSPQVVVLCRSLTAAVVFASLMGWRKMRTVARASKRHGVVQTRGPRTFQTWKTHFALVGLAALGVSFNQTLLFYGLQRTTSAASAILTPMISVFALLISLSLRRESFTWPKFANIALGVSGVVLIFSPSMGSFWSDTAALGNFLCLVSAFLYASYLALSPPFISRIGSLQFSLFVFLYASAINIALYFALTSSSPSDLLDSFSATLPHLSERFWWALGYLVFGATVVTYLLNAYALSILSPGIVGGVVCVQTVLGVSLSHVLLSEPFPIEHIVAMILVILGVLVLWIQEWKKGRPA
jgi:drug/metabolite transporter (DMT)-like permease